MQFSAKTLQNNPNLGGGAPPSENPGSATEMCTEDEELQSMQIKAHVHGNVKHLMSSVVKVMFQMSHFTSFS